MRETKFRAWWKDAKIMVEPTRLKMDEDGIYGIDFYVEVHLVGRKWQVSEVLDEPEQFVLMQYTGLKDNTKWEQLSKEEQDEWIEKGNTKEEWNGREIYEGDVVKTRENDLQRSALVEWGESHAQYYLRTPDPWAEAHNVPKPSRICPLDGFSDVEVIGNIYENPELLEKTV